MDLLGLEYSTQEMLLKSRGLKARYEILDFSLSLSLCDSKSFTGMFLLARLYAVAQPAIPAPIIATEKS